MSQKNSFTKKELLKCASGDLFTKKHSRVPTDPMLMIDRITNISFKGGKFNEGLINAEKDINEKNWFFHSHFIGDPVMPGCLGLDGLWQLTGFFLMGLTSEGNYLAMDGYGPVSVAKVAMEAIIRQIGWELGHAGITANTIQAGITPTRALTKITEDWEKWVASTKKRNPMRRTTTPEDIGATISMLLKPEADFINCSIIYCDGGEHRSGTF